MNLFDSTTLIEWLIFSQVLLALLITNAFTFFYNRRLKKHNRQLLIERQEPQPQPQTSQQEEPAEEPETAEEVEDNGTDIIEVVGGELSESINRALEQTEERLHSLDIDDHQLPNQATTEQVTALLRFYFLESEKLLLPFAREPEQLWNTIQPNYDKIVAVAQSTNQDNKPTPQANNELDSLKNELEQLQSEHKGLEAHMQSISSQWATEHPELEKNHRALIEQAKSTLPELLANADNLLNHAYSLGSVITGQQLPLVDSTTETTTEDTQETDPVPVDTVPVDPAPVEETSLDPDDIIAAAQEATQPPESEPEPEIDEAMQALDDLFDENIEDQSESNSLSDDIDGIIQEIDQVDGSDQQATGS